MTPGVLVADLVDDVRDAGGGLLLRGEDRDLLADLHLGGLVVHDHDRGRGQDVDQVVRRQGTQGGLDGPDVVDKGPVEAGEGLTDGARRRC